LFLEHHVTALYRRGALWEVQKKAGGSETFDAVVLTMPVPQILQLEGDLGNCESLAHRTRTRTQHIFNPMRLRVRTSDLNQVSWTSSWFLKTLLSSERIFSSELVGGEYQSRSSRGTTVLVT